MSPCPFPHAGRIRPVTQEQYCKLLHAGRTAMPRLRPSGEQRLIRTPDGRLHRLDDEPTCLW